MCVCIGARCKSTCRMDGRSGEEEKEEEVEEES